MLSIIRDDPVGWRPPNNMISMDRAACCHVQFSVLATQYASPFTAWSIMLRRISCLRVMLPVDANSHSSAAWTECRSLSHE